jgi:Ca2+/Na+ antiporter
LQTAFDWITIAIFAGLVVLLMQRSTGSDEPRDSLWQYLVAAAGCSLANYIGNHGYVWVAVATLAGTIAFIIYVLKPFDFGSKP